MSDIRNEFKKWQCFRKIFNNEGERIEDVEACRLKGSLYLDEGMFFEAYRSYWHAQDEIGIKTVFVALLSIINGISLRDMHLAECIALENVYPTDVIFEWYMVFHFWQDGMRLAEEVKNSEWLDRAAIAEAKERLLNNNYYYFLEILEVCSKEALRELYPSIIKKSKLKNDKNLRDIVEWCAEALDDRKRLLKHAAEYFGWFGFRRENHVVEQALDIWIRLGYEKGLKKVRQWAKRDLECRAIEYHKACLALRDEQGIKEIIDRFFDGQLFQHRGYFEGMLEKSGDEATLRRLAQYYLNDIEPLKALPLFIRLKDKDGILRIMDNALAENGNQYFSGYFYNYLYETKDKDILTRLKKMAMRSSSLEAVEMYANWLNEPLTTEEYLDYCEIESRKWGFISEETARKAGISLPPENYINMARHHLRNGNEFHANWAIRKAAELQKKLEDEKK